MAKAWRRRKAGKERVNLIAELVGKGMSDREIGEELDMHKDSVRMYRRRQGLGPVFKHRPKLRVEMPDDFKDFAVGKTVLQVARHYGWHYYRARDMMEVAEVAPHRKRPKPAKRIHKRRGYRSLPPLNTMESRASSHLQKFFDNVYRCDILLRSGSPETYGSRKGLPDAGRDYWHVSGLGELFRDDMLELAKEKGFVE